MTGLASMTSINRNTWARKSLAVAAVLLLSVPSAVGVQRALAPTRGDVAAWLAAAGFEAVYLAVALLVLTPALRRYAQRVALGAVLTAISLNSIADYAARVPGGLSSWAEAQRLFDPLGLALAIAESVPLAALAYAMATLLHRLAEADDGQSERPEQPAPVLAYARELPIEQPYPAPVLVEQPAMTSLVAGNDGNADDAPVAPVRAYTCRHCGAVGLTKAEQLAHGRKHAAERRAQAQEGGQS
jgi:hypothetical protein